MPVQIGGSDRQSDPMDGWKVAAAGVVTYQDLPGPTTTYQDLPYTYRTLTETLKS